MTIIRTDATVATGKYIYKAIKYLVILVPTKQIVIRLIFSYIFIAILIM